MKVLDNSRIAKTFNYLWNYRLSIAMSAILFASLLGLLIFVVQSPSANLKNILIAPLLIAVSIYIMCKSLSEPFKETILGCGIVGGAALPAIILLTNGDNLFIGTHAFCILTFLGIIVIGGKWLYFNKKHYLIPFILCFSIFLIWEMSSIYHLPKEGIVYSSQNKQIVANQENIFIPLLFSSFEESYITKDRLQGEVPIKIETSYEEDWAEYWDLQGEGDISLEIIPEDIETYESIPSLSETLSNMKISVTETEMQDLDQFIKQKVLEKLGVNSEKILIKLSLSDIPEFLSPDT